MYKILLYTLRLKWNISIYIQLITTDISGENITSIFKFDKYAKQGTSMKQT
jgi:hypothetical protein